ncbi:MAG: DEAD/DEAH box helicase [Hyphomonadaceae bacterium]|nr:DEAD/DEAH box helicase [Hyphomonadaceae bacterium]MBP9235720.1 DEAD/DEAH box helicase [Hyphomonadaceae bacterium]
MTQFKDLGLNASILAALTSKGYTQPTPIQLAAIPGVMEGRDLLGIAQTGTGKTAAFALPILHRLAANRKPAPRYGCRALVLSPTRELATQIAEQFKAYGAQMGFSVATIFGGVGHGPQRQALARGVDIIVAAPGRLLDHLGERDADLSHIEIFVLDEADQMLDMGFIAPIRQIVKHLPKQRQNLFFSATMPADIEKLAGELLNRDPLKVSVAPPSTTVERVNQQVVFIEAGRKRGLLTELFAQPDYSRVLVFTRTKRGADKVARILEGGGVQAMAIHGNKSQAQRERALAEFKAGKVRALVATDIAARGIDISSVSHVVQYELPDVPEQYVHRIGRTARAGKDGSAVAFCAEDERSLLRDIERTTRQKIPSADRRNDPALAQLSANVNEDEKRGRSGARVESRGAPQPRRQQQQKPRRDDQRRDQRPAGEAGEHRQHEPRLEGAAPGEGRSTRRRGRGGKPGGVGFEGQNRNGQQRSGEAKSPRSSEGQKPRGPKPTGHRKGQGREQAATRGDVMKVNAGGPKGPVMGADALIRHIASTNPWSKS